MRQPSGGPRPAVQTRRGTRRDRDLVERGGTERATALDSEPARSMARRRQSHTAFAGLAWRRWNSRTPCARQWRDRRRNRGATPLTDEGDTRCTSGAIAGVKGAAHDRPHAEHVEEVARDERAIEQRRAITVQSEPLELRRRSIHRRTWCISSRAESLRQTLHLGSVVPGRASDHHQALRFDKRQRPQQRRRVQGRDGDRPGDSQREGQSHRPGRTAANVSACGARVPYRLRRRACGASRIRGSRTLESA